MRGLTRTGKVVAGLLLALGSMAWCAHGEEPPAPTVPVAKEPAPPDKKAPPQPKEAPAAPEKDKPVTLKEIVVTGTRAETPVVNVPADVTVVTEERLQRPGAKMFKDGLTDVPGVKLSTRQDQDVATTGIEIRGLGTNATSGTNALILLDGIPQRRLSFGGPYMGALPFYAVSRMELVKGPLGSLYGRGALAGALQLFTSPGAQEYHADLWTLYEGTTRTQTSALRVSGPLEGSPATFSLTGSATVTDGWQPRTDGRQNDVYLHLEVPVGSQDKFTLLAGHFNTHRNMAAPVLIDEDGHRLPGIDRDTNLSVPNHNSLDMQEYRAGTIWDRQWDDGFSSKLTVAYWNANTTWMVGRPTDAPASGTVVTRPTDERFWQEDSWYSELQLQQKYRLADDIEGTLTGGGSYELWTYDSRMQTITGTNINIATMVEPDPSTWVYGAETKRATAETDHGFFLKNQTGLFDRLDVTFGARFDAFRRRQTNLVTDNHATVSDNAISPGAGVAWHLVKDGPHALTAYANWGKGFSPVYRAVGTTEIVQVDPETSESWEAGLKGSAFDGKIEGTASVYRLDRKDVVGTDPATNMPANIGDWRIDGVETGLKLHPAKGLTVYGDYTVRSPEIRRDRSAPQTEGNDIPGVAEQMTTFGVEYNHSSGLMGGVEDRYTTTSFADAANQVHLPAYNLVDAYVGYRWNKLSVSVFAKNIFDQEYYADVFNGVVHGSAFEGTPRTIGMTVGARF